MKFMKNAFAGTLESSDAFVQIQKSNTPGVTIELESSVEEIYGEDIRKLIDKTVHDMGVDGILLKVQDKGALDFVIEARVQTAIIRACEKAQINWSKL